MHWILFRGLLQLTIAAAIPPVVHHWPNQIYTIAGFFWLSGFFNVWRHAVENHRYDAGCAVSRCVKRRE